MITYNHEKYIAQAIESVLMQDTTFPIRLFIGEDYSTDSTRKICLKYQNESSNIIELLLNKTNIGAAKNAIQVFKVCQNSGAKYIAMLEGDDYWMDPFKIQKQVDFLEANSEYGLVHTDVNHWYEKNGTLVKNYNATQHILIPEGDIYYELLNPEKYVIKTPTALFRKELFDQYVDYKIVRKKGWVIDDLFIWLSIAKFAKVKYFPEAMATYRVLNESSSNTQNFKKKIELHRSVYEIRLYFAERYPCDEAIFKKIKTSYVQAMLFDAFKADDQKLAAETKKFAWDNKIYLGLKNRLLYLATQSEFFNRLLNKLW
jgi:glycosyltransferase involved in cell wall biosynthesis